MQSNETTTTRALAALLYYDCEDYDERHATEGYKNAVKAACECLGISYSPRGAEMQAEARRRMGMEANDEQ